MTRHISVLVLLLGLLLVGLPSSPAVDEKDISRAVKLGTAFLRSQQGPDGRWAHTEIGATALAGLGLLECDVPARDPSIQAAARAIRQDAVGLTKTYSLALCILFLDRLGLKEDEELIQLLGSRLVGGQANTGGWTYECPALVQTVKPALPQPFPVQPGEGFRGFNQRRPLPVAERALDGGAMNPVPGNFAIGAGDNSNTQFALLGLWTARRHNVNVDAALLLADRRFRVSQGADGGWDYTSSGGVTSTPSMTCAGLMALGFAFGLQPDEEADDHDGAKKTKAAKAPPKKVVPRDPAQDPAFRNGLLALGSVIGNPVGRQGVPMAPASWNSLGGGYYFLWSLERVAMTFGLKTIGKKDWYGWGAEILLLTQMPDGSWRGSYPMAGVDTSFALLFLRRSNLAQDLTNRLRGRVQDPGEILLKRGGVGGDALRVGVGMKPAIELQARGEEPGKTEVASRDNNSSKGSPEISAKGLTADQLGARLITASADLQQPILEQLRDGKGVAFTQALSEAIPRLNGAIKSRAREALAERMGRMNAETLRDKLKDSNLEIRRATALACASKEALEFIPDLIELLKDPEPPVQRAAHAALKDLSRKDFGPVADASRAEREKAIDKWREWWEKKGKR